MERLQEQNRKIEEEYILSIQNQEAEEKKENRKKEDEPKEVATEKEEEKTEEKSPLIYGRSAKLKETLVKVADLSVDSGRVLLDGEILNVDSRELKTGKLLAMFDLYDGTSTITCKAFWKKKRQKKFWGN